MILLWILGAAAGEWDYGYDCAALGFAPRDGSRIPKIVDMFLYDGEVEALEMRVEEYGRLADEILVVESAYTFTGNAKPSYIHTIPIRYFYRNRLRFLNVSIPLHDFDGAHEWWRWGFTPEFRREHRIRQNAWAAMEAAIHLDPGDIVIFSDADEILSRKMVWALKYCDGFTLPAGFPVQLYYYSFTCKGGNPWTIPVLKFVGEGMAVDARIRNLPMHPGFSHANPVGWHCSWCFERYEDFIRKVESYSHTEHNKERYKERDWIQAAARDCRDLFERSENPLHPVEIGDLPAIFSRHPHKFPLLLDRADPRPYHTDLHGIGSEPDMGYRNFSAIPKSDI
jgi:beta-1,4-mannosyl-glycoprotein beta-1,4-N-acetylglucosaminyltransferase